MTPEEMQAEMERLKTMGTFGPQQLPQMPQMPGANYQPGAVNNIQSAVNQSMMPAATIPQAMQPMQPLQMPQAPQAPQAPQEKPGLLSRIGSGIQDFVQDKDRMMDLQAAFNSMRFAPDAGIQQAYADRQKMRTVSSQANQTAAYLRQQGQPELAAMVEANPALAKDALAEFAKNKRGTSYASKNIGSIQVAEEDMTIGDTQLKAGDQYVITYDPNAEDGYSVTKLGTRGLTSKAKAQFESESQFKVADIEAARERGEKVFDQSQQVNRSIDIMKQARDLAASPKGVRTGVIDRFLPAFDENTAMFNSLRTTLGIDVINSATFGALSVRELDLALSRDIPNTLSGQALVNYLDEKIAAQNKLYREMTKMGRKLQSGIGLGQYMADMQAEIDAATAITAQYPVGDPGMTYALWGEMSNQDRKDYLEASQ
jgi:hypothetical protein